MKDLDLGQLRTFCRVVEEGGFSRAAHRLALSQPAVSVQIKNLEHVLGVRLLERVGRTVTPTAAGTELYRRSENLLAAAEATLSALREHAGKVVGEVRIGTGATACIYLLPPILRQLRLRCPELGLQVVTGTTSEILRRLEINELDVGVVTLPVAGDLFETIPLLEDRYVAIADMAVEGGRPARPADLAAEPLILYEPGGSTRQLVDRWFAAGGQAVNPVMSLGNVEAIKHLVSAGLGRAIVPGMSLKAPFPALSSQPLDPPLCRTIGLALRKDKRLDRALRETIRAFTPSEPPPELTAATGLPGKS